MAIHDIYPGRDDAFDARAAHGLLAVLWRRRLVVLAALLACMAGAVGFVAATPPRYEATAAMLIDPGPGTTAGIEATDAAVDGRAKLLTARTVLARVAARLDLAHDPEFSGAGRGPLGRLLRPDAALQDGVDLRALEQAITVRRPGRASLVEVDATARDPGKAAAIANALVQAYVEDQPSPRPAAARGDAGDLDGLSGRIRDLDARIEAGRARVAAPRADERQVSGLGRALGDARARAADARARLAAVERMARSGRLDGAGPRSPMMERLRWQQAEADDEVAGLARTLGDRHPDMREARERQNRLRMLVRDALARLRADAEGADRAARAQEARIAARVAAALDGARAQAGRRAQALAALDGMERDRAVLEARVQQSEADGAAARREAPPGRVVAEARPPVSPVSPRRTVVGLAAASAGLLLGVAGALLAEGAPAGVGAAAPPDAPAGTRHPRALPRRRYWDDDDEPA